MIYRLTLLLTILFTSKAYNQDWKTYPYRPPGSVLSFPYDEGFHFDEAIEWLYINGHVTGKNTGNEYSFMLSYFYMPAYGFDGFRIFNLANETSNQFYDESLPCIYESAAEDSLNIRATVGFGSTHTEQWVTLTDSNGKMIPFQYHINAESQSGSIDINCNTLKHPLIIADSGFLFQGNAQYSYYYSQTMIDISGILSYNSDEDTVTGSGWIDHQYGTFNPNNGEQYEWFCVQLDNGMDLNIWNIFTEDNKIPDTSNYRICSVYVNDSFYFTTSDFNIERLKFEYTRDSLRCYSQKWNLLMDTFDINLLISVRNSESEVELPFRFFEGSTLIEGSVDGSEVKGKGFAELLHSYDKPEFSVIHPGNNGIWKDSESVKWQLLNPDEGNPVLYSIDISYNRGDEFLSIVHSIRDTACYWNPSYFTEDSIIILHVTACSIDSTLIATKEVTSEINPPVNEYMLCPGDSISLFISLGNKDEFEYQWLKEGEYISEATDSIYTAGNIQAEDNGSYRCIITGNIFRDTTVSFDLVVNTVYETYIYGPICKNDSIYAGGSWQYTAGIYYDTLGSVYGCDSIVETTLYFELCDLDAGESSENMFEVLPNPASKSVFIEFNNYFTGSVDIINCYGKILRTEYLKDCNNTTIDLSEFINGIYILRFRNSKYQWSIKILIFNE